MIPLRMAAKSKWAPPRRPLTSLAFRNAAHSHDRCSHNFGCLEQIKFVQIILTQTLSGFHESRNTNRRDQEF